MPPRGSSIRVRRSLRTRIYAAAGLAFFGLGALLCIVLPKTYEAQSREHLRERTETTARSLSFLVAEAAASTGSLHGGLDDLESWLSLQEDLESALLLDATGDVVARWPADRPDWTGVLGPGDDTVASRSFYAAAAALPGSIPGRVAVRTSTEQLIHELENVRWLFLSIFLLGGASFFVLARYLQQTVLQPLEDIRRVARNLADGEPEVDMPDFGDDEIAELGAFIRTLGDNRRQSRILRTPKVQELMRRVAAKAEADRAAGRVAGPAADRTEDRACDRSDSDADSGPPATEP